ncbi:hypothetical protein AB0B50_22275 [Streptomyces sp. NPDC041068]|uniref:hypothetical protein n=1 Tax=Streptomyces sp. NPDC041068 TaxID=3155130 RepID=UPI0033D74BDC
MRALHRGPVGAAKRRVIESAVRAARAGEPVGEFLAQLGLGSRAADEGPADDDSVSRSLPPRVPDGTPHALPGHHVCPRDVCGRQEQRAAGDERPVCDVFDLTLRFVAGL